VLAADKSCWLLGRANCERSFLIRVGVLLGREVLREEASESECARRRWALQRGGFGECDDNE
jgi:hypothetical protein